MSPSRDVDRRRPFYPPGEIERLATEALEASALYPASPMPVRVERFVEKHFKLGGVRYETLPASVLGCTIFEAGEVREIAVSRSLCDDPSKVAERRLRTTLAHEAGHGLLHATLFRERYEPSLFDGSEAVQKDKILCRDGEAAARYNGNWWEVQANMMIGALLLPKSLVQEVVGPHTTESVLGASDLPAEKRYAVSRELAEVFDVNPVVAQIRLETLLPLARSDQLTL